MTRWEFAYVDLWLGSGKEVDAVDVQQRRIAEMGAAGWEAAGQVTFTYQTTYLVTTDVSQLMFKRPIEEPS